jgi:hypothetical protein
MPSAVSTSSPIACSGTANKALVWGVSIPFPIKTSNITYYVVGADNSSNTYDIGLYNTSNGQVVHTGPLAGSTFAPTASHYTSQAWNSSGVTIEPGIYYLALTCSATSSTATFGYAYNWVNNGNTSLSVTTGGTLPASLTMPTGASYSAASTPQFVIY